MADDPPSMAIDGRNLSLPQTKPTFVHGGTSVDHSMFTFRRVLPILLLLAAAWSNSTASAADAVLVDFSSSHCGPCVAMQPVIAQLEQSGVPVRHVDVMSEPRLASHFGIRSTPTFVVLVAGKEVTRLTGTQTLAQLRDALAINPSGPLIQTGADWQPQRPELRPTGQALMNRDAAPQTRLTSLTNHVEPGQSPANGMTSAMVQSQSEPMPSTAMANAVQRAEAATVRLRVFDGHGFGAGTGTIIDTQGDEALVLTCGHLFRETKGEGRVEVDLFVAGDVHTVQAQVIGYDADDRDIALVAIRPGFPIQPVPLIQEGMPIRTGQTAFSFGCDRGDTPSRRDTRITGVNKYNQHLGVSNLEISGAPIDGRSGGGLFDEHGRLIGVCNAADYKGDLGIYAGPGTVHWQLSEVNLAHLYQGQSSPNPVVVPERIASLPPAASPIMQTAATQTSAPAISNVGKEVIVIIRDRDNPSGSASVRTITEPTSEFIKLINQHAQ